ncbi:phage holin family protein [Halomonas janggokensis]|uniref:Phage holin family protein n=1 Tax=Vreelandella janggokensis TaxID=370767 RepID=A0ABT4ITV5_9GAMM|nr:phage holin family protein [Halomonas janggokensis]MCZ0926449.1 phage holin family protein [Halomonas janggokensis]MCZ0928987.1 phage holin family protein [Halomonas janggokensis]
MANEGLLQTVVPAVAAVSYFIAALRLVLFRRRGLRYKRHVSLLASALVGTFLCAGLEIIFFKPDISIFQSALALMFCVLTLRTRGNVATLTRVHHDLTAR